LADPDGGPSGPAPRRGGPRPDRSGRGILVFEVKAGEIARDGHGRWWAGHREPAVSTWEQAGTGRYAFPSGGGATCEIGLPTWVRFAGTRLVAAVQRDVA